MWKEDIRSPNFEDKINSFRDQLNEAINNFNAESTRGAVVSGDVAISEADTAAFIADLPDFKDQKLKPAPPPPGPPPPIPGSPPPPPGSPTGPAVGSPTGPAVGGSLNNKTLKRKKIESKLGGKVMVTKTEKFR